MLGSFCWHRWPDYQPAYGNFEAIERPIFPSALLAPTSPFHPSTRHNMLILPLVKYPQLPSLQENAATWFLSHNFINSINSPSLHLNKPLCLLFWKQFWLQNQVNRLLTKKLSWMFSPRALDQIHKWWWYRYTLSGAWTLFAWSRATSYAVTKSK